MSKKLRVFFLSVFVVMLASSMASALSEIYLDDGATYADGVLTFEKSGYLILPNEIDGVQVRLDEIVLNDAATEVELRLPAPYVNVPTEGMHGKWKITFADAKTQKFTIKKHGDSNAAIIPEATDYVDDDTNYWYVPEKATLVINAPLRAVTNDTPFSLHAKVEGHLIFDENGDVFGNGSLNATGFVSRNLQRSLIEVEDGGKLTVKVSTALQGTVDVWVKDEDPNVRDGILVIDVPNAPTHNLNGAILAIDGYIQVDKDLRIADGTPATGGIIVTKSDEKTFKKTGSAKLTIGAGIFNQEDIVTELAVEDTNISKALVIAGTLYLDGSAEYDANGKRTKRASMHNANVIFTVSNDATLQLAKMSVQQANPEATVLFDVLSGNLIMADHSVYALDVFDDSDPAYKEIYPYEEYYSKHNAMRIDIGDGNDNNGGGVELDVKNTGKVTINGIQAFTQVRGAGAITVNGEGNDKGVIIFAGRINKDDVVDITHFNNFKGTITGTNANVGLWSGHFTDGLFKDATITADNLILYGYVGNNTVLDITEKNHKKLQDGFNHIYLRSNRPGADNTKALTMSTMLTIGKISFSGIVRNTDKLREDSHVYAIKSLKVDATHVEDNAGTVDTDGGYRIVDLKKVQLYANRDLDFNGDFRLNGSLGDNDAKGMYAIRFGAGYDAVNNPAPMSTIYWNADGVTGDGDSVDTNKIFSVQVLQKANVIVYGSGTDNYSFAKNNSVLVKQDGKLEFPFGAKINGNLTLEASTGVQTTDPNDPQGVMAWYEDDDQPSDPAGVLPNMDYPREEYFSPYFPIDYDADGVADRFSGNKKLAEGVWNHGWWDNARLNTFTVLTTRLTKETRVDNNGGTYAVTVEGTLALSGDTALTNPNTPAAMYPGKVMVRVKPDLDILDASDETVGTLTNGGQRFKVVGKETGAKTNDFVPVYNAIYGFRIPRERANADTTGGVVFELRRNVGQLTLRNWEFTEDGYGDEFGLPNGHNFKIRIYYDQKGTIPANTDTWNYQLGRATNDGVNDDFDDDGLVTYFGEYPTYKDYRGGVEHTTGQENVLDEGTVWYAEGGSLQENKPGRAYVSRDIQFTARLIREAVTDRNGNTHAGYIELVGTSYQEIVKLPKIAIARNNIRPFEVLQNVEIGQGVALDPIKSFPFWPASPALYSMYVVPSYKQYTFARNGVTIPADNEADMSNVTPRTEGSTSFIEGSDASVTFVVPGMWKAPNAATSAPVLTENGYVWNYGASNEDMYYMKDSNGRDVRVNNLVLRVYKGLAALAASEEDYTDYPAESFDIEVTADGAVITAPASVLGTAEQFSNTRQVSLRGKRADETGTIYTNPLTYTLFAASTGESSHAEDLDLTITSGDGTGTQRHFAIDYSDLGVTNGNNIHLLAYNLPSWITLDGLNGDIISYTVTGTPDAIGTFTYSVLAYDSSTGASKEYTFTVTVNPVEVPTLTATSATVSAGKSTTVTLTVTGGDDDTRRTFAIKPLGGNSPTNIFDMTSGINITGNGTATLNVTTVKTQTPGTFKYSASESGSSGLYAEFSVTVREPDRATVTIDSYTIEGYENELDGELTENYTYHAAFTATLSDFEGDLPEVEWSIESTDMNCVLYTLQSMDYPEDEDPVSLFIVEGVAKRNIRSGEDVAQLLKVSARAGTVEVEEPTEIEVTVVADENVTEGYVTYPNSKDITFTGDSNAVTTGYRAMFPANTIASASDVTLPLWLAPVLNDDEDVIGVRFVGYPLGDLENGSKATVRIYAYDNSDNLDEDDTGDRYYGWDVVYMRKPKDLSIDLSPSTLSLQVGGTATATATASDAQGSVTFALSKDEAISWVTIDPATGVVTATNPTTAGEFTVTVVAQDSRGEKGQATADLPITVGVTPLIVSADPASVTFDTPTAAAKTVALSSNKTGTTYTASVSPSTGLTAAVSGSTLTLTPSVAGSYTVTVTGTNGTETPATATVSVTVGPNGDFKITADPTNVTFDSPTAAAKTVALSAENASGTVTYTATVSPSTGLTPTVSGNTLTLTPSADGSYTVTVTGTNNGKTATATVNVTVEPAKISVSKTSVTFTSSTAEAQTVTLSSTMTGTTTYTASVSPSTGLTAEVSGSTLTLKPSAAGTYTVTVTGTNGTETKTATVNVTVGSSDRVGSSGGGCDAGFGALALVLAAPLFLRRRRS